MVRFSFLENGRATTYHSQNNQYGDLEFSRRTPIFAAQIMQTVWSKHEEARQVALVGMPVSVFLYPDGTYRHAYQEGLFS